jgi:nucleotide-binding universal stress UspA family protein
LYQRILIAVDGSPVSDQALRHGLALVLDQHADVRLIHVVQTMPVLTGDAYIDFDAFRDARVKEGQEVIAHVTAVVHDTGLNVEPELVEVQEQPVGDAILSEAHRWSADLITIGTHGRGGLLHLLMGSVAEAVVRHAVCPVLLVRGTPSS